MGLLNVLSSMIGVATCTPLLYPCLSVSHCISFSLSSSLFLPLCSALPLCMYLSLPSLCLSDSLSLSPSISLTLLSISLCLFPLPHTPPHSLLILTYGLRTWHQAHTWPLSPAPWAPCSFPFPPHPGLCIDLSQTPPDRCAQSDPCFAQQHKKIRATNGFFPC